MADELLTHRKTIADQMDRIRQHSPAVKELYRGRLKERIMQALADVNISVNDDDLLREVAIFAERSDVAEEVTRLASHLDQFRDVVMKEEDGPGRKLNSLRRKCFAKRTR